MHIDDGLDVDAELAELLRRAAAGLPAYRPDPVAVARRRRAIRRRHALGVAAGLTAAALVGGVALLGAGGIASRPATGTPPAAPRLFLTGASQRWQGGDGREVGLAASGLAEVLPDGRLVAREVPGLPVVQQAVGLPDGGFVAMGYRTPMEQASQPAPGASRTPPPAATEAERETVAVVRPDGSVRYLTDTAGTWLIGADDRRVFLGGAGTIALDLATGRQQTLDWRDLLSGGPLVAGRFAVLAGSGDPSGSCALRLVDATTGTTVSERPLPTDDCYKMDTALSPDGRWLAVTQPGPLVGGNLDELKVILLNVDTGEQTVQLLDEGTAAPGPDTVILQGVAWLDDARVRVVWVHLPDHVDRLYDRSEVLRMTTVPVPVR